MVEAPEISGFPDAEDGKNFVVASIVTGLAFAAFYQDFTVSGLAFFSLASAAIVFSREVGVRSAVNLLDGYVDLEVSSSGATTTLFGAILSIASGIGVILLFPLFSEASRERYEQWGKSTDVIWARYSFYISALGIVALLFSWFITYSLELTQLAQMYGIFAFFQMMPFDYSGIPTGPLDGAKIIRWSGFYWLLFTGLSLLAIVLTL
ncbi:hypothetical protein ACK3SF_02305 [Candidatus Nanosalina sp. VS9-1]|uniref:hypothetical protein n=1 Tax=Candidatus Nanosalina sp. VS9-1 TaxID=3388566 RepID=UPI0039DFFDED